MLRDLVVYTPMYVTFFWCIVLLIPNSKNNRAKHFLGFFMLAAFLLYLCHAIFFKGLFKAYLWMDPVYTFVSLSVYPLYYWYIKLLSIETAYKWYNLRMLLPAAILFCCSVGAYLLMTSAEQDYYLTSFLLKKQGFQSGSFAVLLQEIFYVSGRIIFIIQVFFFLIHGRNLILRYNSKIANFYSNLNNRTILWVKTLLYSLVLTSGMSIIFTIIGRTQFMDSTVILFIPSSIFSILLFFIGLQGYMQNHTVVDFLVEENMDAEISSNKVFNQDKLKRKLLELFAEQKPYRNMELKITQVSKELSTNRTYVSNLINNEFLCSFSDFVNNYRVDEAKELLADPAYDCRSLESVAELVGFGSLNTFIRVFKQTVGVTPGRYRSKIVQAKKSSPTPPKGKVL
ncbi:Helix-turn-helix domain-containing protein [Draconibacterium orientale]|uniref:Helix-turn-helix domain-containing protein n=2 Tax=Draconibacterium orientale TaxID=1168034 RepID=A0A1I0D9Z3_9BACT|nr:helix-turn-helix transcriptional regulator [Draconibacterium orientale]SET28492.1 Helix-turn-helix domain-containing protein [Draconibacterium orientale]